jgi:putative acyl-CoA dehydrogenase
MKTHEVSNQSTPLQDVNLFSGNRPLRDALALHAPDLDVSQLVALGADAGSAAMQTHARLANTHAPQLQLSRLAGQCDATRPAWRALVRRRRRSP